MPVDRVGDRYDNAERASDEEAADDRDRAERAPDGHFAAFSAAWIADTHRFNRASPVARNGRRSPAGVRAYFSAQRRTTIPATRTCGGIVCGLGCRVGSRPGMYARQFDTS